MEVSTKLGNRVTAHVHSVLAREVDFGICTRDGGYNLFGHGLGDERGEGVDDYFDPREHVVKGVARLVQLSTELEKLLGFGCVGIARRDTHDRELFAVFGEENAADMEAWRWW